MVYGFFQMYSQLYQWQMEYIISYQKTVPNFSICQISTGTQIFDPLSWFTSVLRHRVWLWWIYSAQSIICHYLMLQFVKNLGADSWIYFPISTLEARKGFSGAEEMAQLGKCLRCKLTDLNLIQKSHKKGRVLAGDDFQSQNWGCKDTRSLVWTSCENPPLPNRPDTPQ